MEGEGFVKLQIQLLLALCIEPTFPELLEAPSEGLVLEYNHEHKDKLRETGKVKHSYEELQVGFLAVVAVRQLYDVYCEQEDEINGKAQNVIGENLALLVPLPPQPDGIGHVPAEVVNGVEASEHEEQHRSQDGSRRHIGKLLRSDEGDAAQSENVES